MTRTALWLAGLLTVVVGTTLWARWWVDSSEPPPEAPLATPTRPAAAAPAQRPSSMRPTPSAVPPLAAEPPGASAAAAPVAPVLPLPLLLPPPPSPADELRPDQPDAGLPAEPPEFKHLRRLSDPSVPRTRLPPPNAPRIPIDSLLRR